MIMGIAGFVATIPGTICAGICGAATTLIGASGIGILGLILSLGSGAAALYYGISSKAMPRSAGVVMLSAAFLTLLFSFFTFNLFWGLIAVACFSIGGAVSLTQEKINA